jgi:hypothetical protein
MNEQNAAPESEVIDPEIVESTALSVIPETINQLSVQGAEGQAVIKARRSILEEAIKSSIAITHPDDWVMFRDTNTGRITCYLQDSGCKRIVGLWGIEIRNLRPFERIEEDGQFAYTITGDGYCALTNTWIREVEGVRRSNEDFVKNVNDPLLKNIRVRQAARANMDGNCIRRLTGLQTVPVQMLDEVWKGTTKSSSRCSKGRGFGTQDQRRGVQENVQDRPDIPAPICDDCQVEMEYHAAGKSKDGKSTWEAFYRCPKYQWDNATRKSNGHSRMKAADWENTQRPVVAQESEQTGTEG